MKIYWHKKKKDYVFSHIISEHPEMLLRYSDISTFWVITSFTKHLELVVELE